MALREIWGEDRNQGGVESDPPSTTRNTLIGMKESKRGTPLLSQNFEQFFVLPDLALGLDLLPFWQAISKFDIDQPEGFPKLILGIEMPPMFDAKDAGNLLKLMRSGHGMISL